MKEHPILFSAPMVRAILEGRKTVTRRVVKPQPMPCDHSLNERRSGQPVPTEFFNIGTNQWACRTCGEGVRMDRSPDGCSGIKCPYGQSGGRLWVRETWQHNPFLDAEDTGEKVIYRAGWNILRIHPTSWRPSIHMPRWASRITLEVTGVRVERLQDVSEADALAEGIERVPFYPDEGFPLCDGFMVGPDDGKAVLETSACKAFRKLWESINGAGSWNANPWVWVVEFKRVTP